MRTGGNRLWKFEFWNSNFLAGSISVNSILWLEVILITYSTCTCSLFHTKTLFFLWIFVTQYTTKCKLMPKKSIICYFFPNHASYDRLPELGNNRNAQFDVFHRPSHAISTMFGRGLGSVLLSGSLCKQRKRWLYLWSGVRALSSVNTSMIIKPMNPRE
jgi:hypothetical protein